MKKKEIILCGKHVIIAYCFATEIVFQEYTGVGLDKFDSTNPEHIIYIVLAALLSYYESEKLEIPVKDTDLMYKASSAELTAAMTEIFTLRNEWYEVPKGDKKDDQTADKEGKEKNA